MTRKTADERRADALDAARRLILTAGIAHASVRNVAAEAGMSTGSLRHIFPNHDDLFVALLEDAVASAAPRIQDVIDEASAAGRPPVDIAVAALLEVVPTREDTRLEALSQLAVLVAHGGNPRVLESRRRAGAGLDFLCRRVLEASAHPERADATELRLILDGLLIRLLEDPQADEDEVRARLRGVLVRMGVPEA